MNQAYMGEISCEKFMDGLSSTCMNFPAYTHNDLFEMDFVEYELIRASAGRIAKELEPKTSSIDNKTLRG